MNVAVPGLGSSIVASSVVHEGNYLVSKINFGPPEVVVQVPFGTETRVTRDNFLL